MIEVREVLNRKDLKKFVKFPLKLYRNDPYFIPVLISDEMNEFTKETNDAFSYCDSRQWIAYKDGKIVGRIAGIFNRQYNEKIGRKQMRFTRFDTIDDIEVTKALFEEIKKYAKETDSKDIVGPLGFCDIDKEGMVTKGFDQISIYITPYNKEYYVNHVKQLGFVQDTKWVEYKIKMPTEVDPRLEKVSQYVQKKHGYEIVKFKNINEVVTLIKEGLHIMNEVYSHLYGYVSLTDKQIEQFSLTLKPLVSLEYVCAVKNSEGKLIGYGFVAPSIGKAFQKGHGHLFPLTIFRLMHSLKHNDTIDLYSVGVLHEYQNTGVNGIVMNEILKACVKNGIKYAETGPEMESNHQIQAQWKDYEKEIHKERVCFKLTLEENK